jgi:hypothetical protein
MGWLEQDFNSPEHLGYIYTSPNIGFQFLGEIDLPSLSWVEDKWGEK